MTATFQENPDTPSVFLSHSSLDKPFARRLASRLEAAGVRVWIDEAEIKIGDPLYKKIDEALSEVDYVAAVLSANSVASKWVDKELQLAMTREIETGSRRVLPIRIDDCPLPSFLSDKLYADFRNDEEFESAFSRLLRSIGIATDHLQDGQPGLVSAQPQANPRSPVLRHLRTLLGGKPALSGLVFRNESAAFSVVELSLLSPELGKVVPKQGGTIYQGSQLVLDLIDIPERLDQPVEIQMVFEDAEGLVGSITLEYDVSTNKSRQRATPKLKGKLDPAGLSRTTRAPAAHSNLEDAASASAAADVSRLVSAVQGALKELAEALPAGSPARKDIEAVGTSIEPLADETDAQVIQKSSSLSRLRGFVEDLGDDKSRVGKAAKGLGNFARISKTIAAEAAKLATAIGASGLF